MNRRTPKTKRTDTLVPDTTIFRSKGVRKDVENGNETMAKAVQGFDADDQVALDKRLIDLDGTENKGRLGANALLGVSLANAHAVAESKKLPLWKMLAGHRAQVRPRPDAVRVGQEWGSTGRSRWFA